MQVNTSEAHATTGNCIVVNYIDISPLVFFLNPEQGGVVCSPYMWGDMKVLFK